MISCSSPPIVTGTVGTGSGHPSPDDVSEGGTSEVVGVGVRGVQVAMPCMVIPKVENASLLGNRRVNSVPAFAAY
jgi:hypothetical protein